MLEHLFKFDAVQFAEGEVGFQAGPAVALFLVLLVGVVVVFGVVYTLTNLYTDDRSKAISLGLRLPVLLLLFLPLFEPVLITPDVVPDENFVAVLVDGSESMTLPDGTFGETRGDDARHLLLDENDGLLSDLGELFKIRLYTFSDDARRTDSLGAATGEATDITAALDRVLADFRGLPLSGVVLLTDGGDNSDAVPLNTAEALKSLGIPLHIVGLGREAFEAEREILDAVVHKGVGETAGAEIDLKVRSWMDEAGPVTFNLYRGSELVFTEQRRLKGGGKIDQFSLFYEPQQPGAAAYALEVAPARDERNTENNQLPLLIDTRNDTLRVLYFEGHLRQEFKFIKRALEDDTVIDFASVSRTNTGRYYRQGIKQADELAGGFPASEEELYGFKAVIFGDVEASAFSPEQLRMIESFVRVRGGGFLMIGGRNAFAEGDYGNTPIADLLPVTLDESRRMVLPPRFSMPDKPPAEQGFRFVPTAAGAENPILKFSPDPATNRQRWSGLPGLTSINYLGAVKPGATVLAEKAEDDFGEREPVLAIQRYGKGRAAALATASTWRWQMLVDASDARHERFWRQMARWLVASAPNRVHLDLGPGRFAPGDAVALTTTVYDARFQPRPAATVRGRLTDPFGITREIEFQEELTAAGTYTFPFVPTDEGVYELDVMAFDGTVPLGMHRRSFLVQPSKKEFHDATLKRRFLEGLAAANDGHYYAPDEAAAIPANLRSRRTSTSIFHAAYLWDLPVLFGLIILLLSLEWMWRRRKGLP